MVASTVVRNRALDDQVAVAVELEVAMAQST